VDDDAIRRQALTEVIQTGFRERQRVLYCGADTGEVLAASGHRGLPVAEALASGDLRVPPIGSSCLSTGVFDQEEALRFLRREIDDARQAGYPGLRLLIDMSWASRPAPGVDGLPEYEARANTIFAEGYALAVCAYDPRVFDPPALRGFAQAHLGTVARSEVFDPGSVLRVRHTRRPFGLCLEGEADLMNQSALRAVVDHLLDNLPSGQTTATIDLSGLRFVDTAAARILLVASRRAAGRLRFLGWPRALNPLFALYGAGEPAGTA
jgi:ABC-type transporter Mla MlaB component